jgi:replicative DNA helicase
LAYKTMTNELPEQIDVEEYTPVEASELEGLTNPDARKDERYRWDEDFQRMILGLLLNDRWFVNQCRDLISPAYFSDERHQTLCKILFDYVDVYKSAPPKIFVVQEVRQKTANRDEGLQLQYLAETEIIYKKFVPGLETRESLLDKIVNFAKLMSLKLAFDKSIAMVKRSPESEETWTGIREELQKALIVERNFEEGLNYFATFEERYARMAKEEEAREIFTSGFEMIDDALLGGGCHRGEIYSWIGLSGSGKSLALVGAALKNVRQFGKRVLYISLEMGEDAIAERFDAQLADVDINQLQELKDKIRAAFDEFNKDQEDKRMLVIKQFPAGSMSVASLRAYMQQLKMLDFTPDLLVIDYIGEMKDYPGMPTYESRYRIVRDLRGLATEENICIFTAMQPNKDAREAQKKDSTLGDGVIDDTNLADSYGQIRPLDGCWSINQMHAEKEAGIARLFVIKHRHGRSRFTCHAQFDKKTLQIRQISEIRYNEIWREYSFKKTERLADTDNQVSKIVSKGKIKGFSNDVGYEDPDQPDERPPLEEGK